MDDRTTYLQSGTSSRRHLSGDHLVNGLPHLVREAWPNLDDCCHIRFFGENMGNPLWHPTGGMVARYCPRLLLSMAQYRFGVVRLKQNALC